MTTTGGPTDGGPTDPITKLAEGAVALHELKVEYMKAGFTEPQALYLVGVVLAAALRKEPGSP